MIAEFSAQLVSRIIAKVKIHMDLASCAAYGQSHRRRKIEYQNLSPYRAAAKPQPIIKPRAPRARAPENWKESGITEKNISKIMNTPKNAPQTKRIQNSSLSVLGIFSAVILIRSLAEGLGGWLLFSFVWLEYVST